MRLRGLPGGIAHHRDDHPLALDTAAEDGRITRPAHDLVDVLHVEDMLRGTGAFRAWGACFHGVTPSGLYSPSASPARPSAPSNAWPVSDRPSRGKGSRACRMG